MGPTFVEEKFGEDQYNRRAFILRNYEIMEILLSNASLPFEREVTLR